MLYGGLNAQSQNEFSATQNNIPVKSDIGISSVFYVTGALFLGAFGLLWWSMRHSETTSHVKDY